MSFSGIKGHNPQIKALLDSVGSDRLAASYLFLGPQGIGKKTLALNFAKFLSCSSGAGDCCDECVSCVKINKFQHPDVFFISGECSDADEENTQAAIKIGQIREVIKRSAIRPYEAKYKVFIIDDAENLTDDAANALLKTLEEPPKDTIFFLIAKDAKSLLPTIVSRCKRLRFNALKINDVKDILVDEHHLDENKAHFLSYYCEGRLGEALKFKDKNILDEKNIVIDNFLSGRIDFKSRDAARRGLNIFLGWLRDILISKMDNSHFINIDRKGEIIKNKDKYDFRDLEIKIAFIFEALSYLQRNINLRLFNNLVRIKLCRI